MTSAGNDTARFSRLIAPAYFDLHLDVKQGLHREYWLAGGRGSAKSSFISLEIIRGMITHKGANAMVYRRVGNTLRESVYEQLAWAIGMLGLEAWFEMKLAPLEIRYKPTGQRILFRGADDPGKSKSIKLAKGYFGYLWFEELAEFKCMQDVRTIKASVIRGADAITFCSYNPPMSARNWVNTEALVPRSDRYVHKSTYLDVPPEWLGESFLAEAQMLKNSNERAYRHMYLGEAVGTGGSVFENISLREITDAQIGTFGATYAGLDFGWFPDPLHFARCCYDPANRRLFVFDEFRTIKMRNRDVYDLLVQKKGLTAAEEVIADSAEQKSVSDMRYFGMRCVGAAKGPGSVRASIQWLQGLNEIVIDPIRCPEAAREFSQYEYEKTADGAFSAAYLDADNHAIDAVRYATNRIWMRCGA